MITTQAADGLILTRSMIQEGPVPTNVPGVPSEGAPAGPAPGATGTQPAPSGMPAFFWPFLLVMAFMIFSMFMTGRREKRRVAQMLGSLKRGDRVQMSGGMQGTIVEIKDDAVVLRVDETTNTKIHFARTAVQAVLREAHRKDAEPALAESKD